jgi:hypothetical protein
MTPVVRSSSCNRGISMVESLIALPLLFMVGLGAVQFALVMHARQALNFALIEAARAGSVGHAEAGAIRSGLSRGLVPWLYGANDLGEYAINLARAAVHIRQGEAIGWMHLAQLSPTNASFDDWAEPARDANGGLMADVREIPNDNLVARAEASGAPAVGAASGQTLADANLLRLRLDYGVPLVVPVVGRLISSAVRVWNGCEIGSPKRIGLIRLDAPPVNMGPRPFPCAMYGSGIATASGVAADTPRLPMSLVATVRMQSPARQGGEGGISESGDGGEPILDVGLSQPGPFQYPTQSPASVPPAAGLSDLHANQASGSMTSASPAPNTFSPSSKPATERTLLQTLTNTESTNDPAVCSIPDT